MKTLLLVVMSVLLLWLAGVVLAESTASQPAIQPVNCYAYWLSADDLGEYVDLLISNQPIQKLPQITLDTTKPIGDAAAVVVRTYSKDSIWNVDRRPFKHVEAVGSVDAGKQRVVLNGREYRYAPVPLRDILALLERPEGKMPVHRINAPLAGAEDDRWRHIGRVQEDFRRLEGRWVDAGRVKRSICSIRLMQPTITCGQFLF